MYEIAWLSGRNVCYYSTTTILHSVHLVDGPALELLDNRAVLLVARLVHRLTLRFVRRVALQTNLIKIWRKNKAGDKVTSKQNQAKIQEEQRQHNTIEFM